MATQALAPLREPALQFFSPQELESVPHALWTDDPTDHSARNWLLATYPKVISRLLREIEDPDFKAPDGSQFRLLTYGKDGQIAHAIFPPKMIANAVIHPRVTEQWYCCRGKGMLWLKNAETSEIKKINFAASSCLMIPSRTAFRFINTEDEPLECVIATTPLWETLKDGESAEHLLSMDEQQKSQVLTQEAPQITQEAFPSSLEGEIRLLQATEQTDRVQMAVWTLPPDTTTKVFRAPSGTESYYILCGKGMFTYLEQNPRTEQKVKLERGRAITCASSTIRKIQTRNKPLSILVVSEPKSREYEVTLF